LLLTPVGRAIKHPEPTALCLTPIRAVFLWVDRQYPSGSEPLGKGCGEVPAADRRKIILDYFNQNYLYRPPKVSQKYALLAE
jgi:hypothetical protein